MLTKIIGLIIVAALIFGALIIADTHHARAEGNQASFRGKLVCLACTLKNEDGARAECRNFGHTHALRTEDGKFISFLENKYSEDLFTGEKYSGKEIRVHGAYYTDANLLDVDSYRVEDKSMTWCETHNTMDTCNSGK